MADWQLLVADSLEAATGRMASLKQGAATQSFSRDTVMQLSGEHVVLIGILKPKRTGVRLQPRLRAAMAALAREVIACNTALSRVLPYVLPYSAQHETLNMAAGAVEHFAESLLTILEFAEERADREEQNFVYLVVSAAGAAVLDCGSLACRSLACSHNDNDSTSLSLHTKVVRLLLETLHRLERDQAPALKALRATACSPEAVLACIRKLFSNDAYVGCVMRVTRSAGTDPLAAGFTCLPASDGSSAAAVELLLTAPVFRPECTAIAEDSQLQARIVARAAADLSRFGVLGSTEEDDRYPTIDAEAYREGAAAMNLLVSPELHVSTTTAAHDGSAFVKEVITATELFLRLDPPPELGPERHSLQRKALVRAVEAMHRLCEPSAHSPPRLLAIKDVLRCAGLAAAAGIRLLQEESDEAQLFAAGSSLSLCMHSIFENHLAVSNIMGVPSGTDVGDWAAHYQALEAMLRLAALLPARWPAGPAGANPPEVHGRRLFLDLGTSLLVVCDHEPSATPERQETWSGLAGLAESAVKFALRTIGPEAESHGYHERRLALVLLMLDRVGLGVWKLQGEFAEDEFPLRRWQGIALAAWGLVAAVDAKECHPMYFRLLLACLRLPPVCKPALATAAGRSLVVQAYERTLLDVLGMEPAASEPGFFWISHDAAVDNPEAALVLARCGVLTRLVSWLEENCTLPSLRALPLGSTDANALVRYFTLVSAAVGASDTTEVIAAFDSIPRGEDECGHLCSPGFWQRLRVEVVEPLALALEARAAAEEGDAARQAQLAVYVAQALATRPCAHPCCTTIVGAREADAPRGKRCGGCQLVRYCGAACQKADWPAHKAACRELVRRRAGAEGSSA